MILYVIMASPIDSALLCDDLHGLVGWSRVRKVVRRRPIGGVNMQSTLHVTATLWDSLAACNVLSVLYIDMTFLVRKDLIRVCMYLPHVRNSSCEYIPHKASYMLANFKLWLPPAC